MFPGQKTLPFFAALMLAGCGGGGGDSKVASIPPPPVSPGVTPSSPPPLPSGPIGLTGGPFTTYSSSFEGKVATTAKDAVQISYSPATNVYTISAPGLQSGNLVNTTIPIGGGTIAPGGASWQSIGYTYSDVTAGNSSAVQTGSVRLDWASAPLKTSDLTYTSFGSWGGQGKSGLFVYGIPTSPGDVPVTGMATYDAKVTGFADGAFQVFGTMDLNFDFARGTLSGSMTTNQLGLSGSSLPLGTYTFRDTLFLPGSTTFSGSFNVPGTTAASSFSGSFTGPRAAELMGNWTAPYLTPTVGTQSWGTISGVFAGKRTP